MEINFLTGPVKISDDVSSAFNVLPVSHRSTEFIRMFHELRSDLKSYTQAQYVEVLSGSGTLANEVIAQQLKHTEGKGLILCNGEFGHRLMLQAECAGLDFYPYSVDWGKSFQWDEVEEYIRQRNEVSWIWMTVHETSTGIWNENSVFLDFCTTKGIKVNLDCISAIGVKNLDLSRVYLASGVSGKAIAAFPGLSFVFYNHEPADRRDIPKYLDLKSYKTSGGIPFTINSNLVSALHIALKECLNDRDRQSCFHSFTQGIRLVFNNLDCTIVNDESPAPNNVTVRMPPGVNSVEIGDSLQSLGYCIGYKSEYLVSRGWIQFFFTRNNTMEEITSLGNVLEDLFACHR